MTKNPTTQHPDLAKPVRTLLCTCCGGRFEGRQFHNQDTGYGLGDCCVDFVKPRTEDVERTYGIDGVHYNIDARARVFSFDKPGAFETWRIAQNLTDRWGEINESEESPATKRLLQGSPELLERLREQQFEEDTFIVRKDGVWGVLFELEFCSKESEVNLVEADELATLPPRAKVIANLIVALQAIEGQYPGVQFTVPDPVHIYEERPAAWAFVPDGLLDDQQRAALGGALQDIRA